jgi:protocatechuate 3,4-dioxygenase beta subunit
MQKLRRLTSSRIPRNSVLVGFIAVATMALGACSTAAPAAPDEAATRPPFLPETDATSTAEPDPGLGPTEEPSTEGCRAAAEPLPALTAGPYFKPGSPARTSLLEPGTVGQHLLLSGIVFDTDCTRLPDTTLDFWQADGDGVYDNAGFRLRGHQVTDAAGEYRLTTVVPGLYPGRTEHIHVTVQPPGGTPLTTQLFFPEVGENLADRIFDARLVIEMNPAAEGWIGTFDFIVRWP